MFVPATDADVPAIVAPMNRAYRGSGSEAGWTTESEYLGGDRTTVERLRADIAAAPPATMLVWPTPDGGPLGCVWLQPLANGSWHLGSLAVEPASQAAGLGRLVLAAAEEWVRTHGGTRIEMKVVNVREMLIRWYERRGYRRTGTIEAFPYGDGRFGTPLRDDLAFVVLDKALETGS